MLRQLLFFTLILFVFNSSLLAQSKDPQEFFFDSTFGDFSEELQTARDDGKKGVFIFFEMDDCPFCHWMKKNVLNQTEVQDYYKKNFSIFSVDIEGDVEITDFAGNATTQKDFSFKQHRVRATPVIAFFDLDGNLVTKFTGRTSGVEEFMLLGQFVVDQEYKKTKFSRYKRAHKK